MSSDREGAVTVIISRRIKPGREQDFETWLKGITQEVYVFPGFLGEDVIRPHSKSNPEYIIILRFDSYANLKRWEESPVRQRWLNCVNDIAIGESQVKKMPGLEFWFTPPNLPPPIAPPRYKMAILLTLTIFGMAHSIAGLLNLLVRGLPELIGQLLVTAIQVMLITYFILPFLTRVLSGWLFAPSTRTSSQ